MSRGVKGAMVLVSKTCKAFNQIHKCMKVNVEGRWYGRKWFTMFTMVERGYSSVTISVLYDVTRL